ncbi:unnamed protein product [Diplocarpon coronariae]
MASAEELLTSASSPSGFKSLLARLPRLEIQSDHFPMNLATLEEFKLFPCMPTEIRLKIWGLLAQEPRCEDSSSLSPQPLLPAKTLSRRIRLRDSYRPSPGSAASNKIEGELRQPALLHINRESRREGLCFYERVEARPPVPLRNGARPDIFFVNFAVDVFEQGVSEFAARGRGAPTQDDYNFPAAVLRRVQRVDQRPCYVGDIYSFEKIYADTERSLAGLCQPFWPRLAHVTARMDEHCYHYAQESFDFHYDLQSRTARYQAALDHHAQRNGVRQSFRFAWKGRDTEEGEALDLVPCPPHDVERVLPCNPFGEWHKPCMLHFRELSQLIGTWPLNPCWP